MYNIFTILRTYIYIIYIYISDVLLGIVRSQYVRYTWENAENTLKIHSICYSNVARTLFIQFPYGCGVFSPPVFSISDLTYWNL